MKSSGADWEQNQKVRDQNQEKCVYALRPAYIKRKNMNYDAGLSGSKIDL